MANAQNAILPRRRKVAILATGGTIAGVGEEGKSVGYSSGFLGVSTLLQSVPGLEGIADIEEHQICNVNSDDITAKIWLQLARRIQEIACRPDIDGIVITHGTDTMEETAFFLSLVLDTSKPIVLTGSMRPATAISADGPMNIFESVAVAACPDSAGRGVLVQFAGQIFNARHVRKADTLSAAAMDGGAAGACGESCDGCVTYFQGPNRDCSGKAEFQIGNMEDLPRVNVLFFGVDSDPALIQAAAAISDGLVIAGAGAGEFSLAFKDEIDKLDIPVVVSSRIGHGSVSQGTMLCKGSIAAGSLPPQKAAVLLRLALTVSGDNKEILRIFRKY